LRSEVIADPHALVERLHVERDLIARRVLQVDLVESALPSRANSIATWPRVIRPCGVSTASK